MISIKDKLRLYLSTSISILLVAILLITDISVDRWIDTEFDRAMINKGNLLVTLINQNDGEVKFNFADEFMPEFSGENNLEYFQLWLNDKVFERSKTLKLFGSSQLPKLDVALHQSALTTITLPDGREGRMYFTTFTPQVDSINRHTNQANTQGQISKQALKQTTMQLAYAVSNDEVEQILWFVDIIFIFTAISSVIIIRFIVSKVVDRGLMPLNKLNSELSEINLNSQARAISTQDLPQELIPIATSINHFLTENRDLYSREKRVTSNIAHELKTPITELLNLSEVAIKFPNEKQITATFTTDVLAIAERLKNITNSILLLQKSSSQAELKKTKIELLSLLSVIISRVNQTKRNVIVKSSQDVKSVYLNEIAITTILSNLIDNALFYSPDNTPISISIQTDTKVLTLNITNSSVIEYSPIDLKHFFEPLWQKDNSRMSTDRFGLGLAITKSYCENIGAELIVNMNEQNNEITFTVIIYLGE